MVVNADDLIVGDDNWRKKRGSEIDGFFPHHILKNNFQASYGASPTFQ